MKTISLIILFLIVTSSCKNRADILGTWIGAYSLNQDTSYFAPYSAIHQILTFKKDSAVVVDRIVCDSVFISKAHYKFEKGVLYLGNEEESIKVELNSDSLVIIGNDNRQRIYKKLRNKTEPDHIKEIKYTGNTYVINSQQGTDTIQFLSNNTYLSKMENIDRCWNQINHSGYEILFLGGIGSSTLVLKNVIGDSLEFSSFTQEEHLISLRKINETVW